MEDREGCGRPGNGCLRGLDRAILLSVRTTFGSGPGSNSIAPLLWGFSARLRLLPLFVATTATRATGPRWFGLAGGRRAFITCPQEGPLDVDPKRLRQWRFDTGRLAELLADALELAGPARTIELGRLWHLGRRRLAGRFRDLFLLAGETDNLSSDSKSCCATAVGPPARSWCHPPVTPAPIFQRSCGSSISVR